MTRKAQDDFKTTNHYKGSISTISWQDTYQLAITVHILLLYVVLLFIFFLLLVKSVKIRTL